MSKIKQYKVKIGDELKMLIAADVKVVENNRGYIELDGIRVVYDFDSESIIGWYKP